MNEWKEGDERHFYIIISETQNNRDNLVGPWYGEYGWPNCTVNVIDCVVFVELFSGGGEDGGGAAAAVAPAE